MTFKILMIKLFASAAVIAAGMILFGFTFSRAAEEKGKSYIIDLHGEYWDVT